MTKLLHVRHPDTLRSAVAYLKMADRVYFDIETMTDGPLDQASEDWHPSSRITAVSFTTEPGSAWVIPLSHPEAPWSEVWQGIAQSVFRAMQGAKLAAHNGRFDIRYVHSTTGVDLADNLVWDTMVSAYVLDENEPKGLKHLAVTELGVPDWSEEIDSRCTERYPWETVAGYAGRDTDYGWRIMERHRERLAEETGLARVFGMLMMPVSQALIRVERNGLLLDGEVAERRLEDAERRITEIEDELLEGYVYGTPLEDEFCWKHYKRKDPVPVRPSWSPNSKFFHAFMEDVGAPVLERTEKKGTPSFSESVMKRIAAEGGHPYIDSILEARKLGKDTGYLKSWLAKRTNDGRLHPSLKPAHVTTGRLASENPNAQQISRHLKDCFIPEEGWWFVQADYAQVELRIAALVAQEENMLEAFREGKDLHRLMASEIAGVEPHLVTPAQRQQAKAVNFGFLYGMGAPKFVDHALDDYGVVFTLEEAQAVRGLFFKKWPRLAEWHEEQRRTAHTQGYIRTAIGRRRRLPDLDSKMKGKVAAAERQAINAPIQSFASDLMLLSIIELDRNPSPHRKVVGTVHDSLLAELRGGHVREEVQAIADAMLYPPVERLFGASLDVPLEVEFLIGTSWGDPEPKVVTVSTSSRP